MLDQSILIVEDTPEMQMLLTAILGTKYRIKVVATTKEAQDELEKNPCDLILVDIDLPGENGFQFCARIKLDERFNQIPFVFLTCHNQTPDIVIGFSLGADDYITKPIIREQFEARISARLRKQANKKNQESVVRYENFSLDLCRQHVFVMTKIGQVEIQLTAIEFRVLKYFLDHEGHILSREQILNEVWGHNLNVTDRTVDTHIYTLRKKMGSFSKSICTVPGVGYRFQQMKYKNAA